MSDIQSFDVEGVYSLDIFQGSDQTLTIVVNNDKRSSSLLVQLVSLLHLSRSDFSGLIASLDIFIQTKSGQHFEDFLCF